MGLDVQARRGVSVRPIDLAHHVLYAGSTGSGKSKSIEHLCRRIVVNRSLSRDNGGLILIDPHWSIASDLLGYMAINNLRVPLVVIHPDEEADDIVAYDPLWRAGHDRLERFGTWVAHLWQRQSNNHGPRLSEGIGLVARAIVDAGGTLADAFDLLNPIAGDRDLRHAIVHRVADESLKRHWQTLVDMSDRLFEFEMGSTKRAMMPLISNVSNRRAAGLGATLSFCDALSQAWIVLIGAGRGRGGLATATLMLDDLWSAAIDRRSSHPPMHLIVDEFNEVLSPAAVPLLPQARKFGLSVTLGMQSPADLSAMGSIGTQMLHAVVHSARTKIVFQLDGTGARTLADAVGVEAKVIQNLPYRHALIRTLTERDPSIIVTDDVPDFGASSALTNQYTRYRLDEWRGDFVFTKSAAIQRFENHRKALTDGLKAIVIDEPDEFAVPLSGHRSEL